VDMPCIKSGSSLKIWQKSDVSSGYFQSLYEAHQYGDRVVCWSTGHQDNQPTKECYDFAQFPRIFDQLQSGGSIVGTGDAAKCMEYVDRVHEGPDENYHTQKYMPEYRLINRLLIKLNQDSTYAKTKIVIGAKAAYGMPGLKDGMTAAQLSTLLAATTYGNFNNGPLAYAFFHDLLTKRIRLYDVHAGTPNFEVKAIDPDWTEGAAAVYAGVEATSDTTVRAELRKEYSSDNYRAESVMEDIENERLAICAEQAGKTECLELKQQYYNHRSRCSWDDGRSPKCQLVAV